MVYVRYWIEVSENPLMDSVCQASKLTLKIVIVPGGCGPAADSAQDGFREFRDIEVPLVQYFFQLLALFPV